MASMDILTEEIIKRKLQIDGDGMGDDRKLLNLARAYTTFVDGENESEDADFQSLKRMIALANQAEYTTKRTVAALKVNEEAKEQFIDLADQVKAEIVETKRKIVESKALLEDATKHRKYSMEYDALAKLIESKPDRKMTELKRMGLQLELDTLKGREQRIDDQLTERRRLLSQLGQNIENVRETLVDFDDKFIKSTVQSIRARNNGDAAMDLDSTSQSDPPSPPEAEVTEVTTNGTSGRKNGTENGPSSSASSAAEKAKSEKYEDLSESDVAIKNREKIFETPKRSSKSRKISKRKSCEVEYIEERRHDIYFKKYDEKRGSRRSRTPMVRNSPRHIHRRTATTAARKSPRRIDRQNVPAAVVISPRYIDRRNVTAAAIISPRHIDRRNVTAAAIISPRHIDRRNVTAAAIISPRYIDRRNVTAAAIISPPYIDRRTVTAAEIINPPYIYRQTVTAPAIISPRYIDRRTLAVVARNSQRHIDRRNDNHHSWWENDYIIDLPQNSDYRHGQYDEYSCKEDSKSVYYSSRYKFRRCLPNTDLKTVPQDQELAYENLK